MGTGEVCVFTSNLLKRDQGNVFMTRENGAIISILPDADRHEAAACRITTEPAVTDERVHSRSRRSTGPLPPSNTQTPPLSASYEINESNLQFIGSALRYCEGFPGADIGMFSGWIAPWRNTAVPITNAIFLSRPVTSEFDLRRRTKALSDYIKHKENPPMVLLCREWIPEQLREKADVQIAATGLVRSTTMTGMAADDLLPASHFDLAIEWRRAADKVTRQDFADINSLAYGFPLEAERAALCVPQVWGDDGLNGYVGYLGDGTPVATAGAMAISGRLHVVCVATRPGYQRRGLAERAIRYGLGDMGRRSGLRRTTLTATEAGAPLYLRMGYHATATFLVYTRRK
jgi:ribosomal protein S18 acetylase RimI-like enzyme